MMKAKDLKADIDWTVEADQGRYSKIASYLTEKWVAEPKLDGVRSKIVIGGASSAVSTWRRDVSGNFPQFAQIGIEDLDATVLDGEIIAPTGQLTTHTGTTTNSLLNASVALTNSQAAGAVATQQKFGKAQFWAFDVLSVAGTDITGWAYEVRRKALETIVKVIQAASPGCEVHVVPQLPATVDSIEASIEAGFEGVMLKALSGTYKAGKRSAYWQKVKRYSTADGFIIGYEPGQNGRSGKVGSLSVAVLGDDGPVPVASLGNLSAEFQAEITASDGSLKADWYGVCVEWLAQGLNAHGRARHAHLVRVRLDKTPQDCTEDQLKVFAHC